MGKSDDSQDSMTEEGGGSMFTRENIVIIILQVEITSSPLLNS